MTPRLLVAGVLLGLGAVGVAWVWIHLVDLEYLGAAVLASVAQGVGW